VFGQLHQQTDLTSQHFAKSLTDSVNQLKAGDCLDFREVPESK